MKGLQVLVVDDDRDFAESLARVFEIEGLRATLAFTGEAALTHLKHDDIDIAFMDIALPGLSGIEALRMIHELRPNMKIVMMTGYITKQYAREARMLGALDILQKPFDPLKAIDTIPSQTQRQGQQ